MTDIHNDILTACVGTARAPPLLTLQKGGKWFPIRAQVNVIMTVPPAGGKTTGTDDDIKNIVPCGDMSIPGLLGTVSKNGGYVPGAASLAAGKVLWLDEYQGASKFLFRKLLNLLETGKAQRSLGFPLTANIAGRSKYGKVIGIKGTGHFEVESRFSCLMTGTVKPSVQQRDYMQMGGGGMKAWMDAIMLLERFMHVDMRLERKDFYGVISGDRIFDVRDYSQYYTEQQKMPDYMELVKWHRELVESEPFRFLSALPDDAGGFLSRNCQDMARILAFGRVLEEKTGGAAKHGQGGFAARGKLEHYVYQALYSVVVGSLTFSEYKVFMNMRKKDRLTQEEIASELGITQPAVSKMEERLEKCKLLESSKNP